MILRTSSFLVRCVIQKSKEALLLLTAVLALAVGPASAQLSQNSGINAADTYAIFDLTLQGQGTSTLSQPLYNPTTNTTSSTLNLSPNARHYHVEVGYDLNDQLVLNLYSTDSTTDPTQSPYGDISKVQLTNGKLTVFDETGTPIPISLPNDAPLPLPLELLGAIPGSSVLNSLIISNPSATATAMNGTVLYSTYTTASANTIGGYAIAAGTPVQMAYISYSVSPDTNGSGTLAYQQFSGGWVLTQTTENSSFPNVQSTMTGQIANLQWYDNATGDSRRAAKATPPPAVSPFSAPNVTPPLAPGPSTSTPTIDVVNLGTGPTNLLYQHGILSSASTWDRMDGIYPPWLRADFGFATIAKPSLTSTAALTNQANDLINLFDASRLNNFLAIGHSQGGLIVRDVAFRRFDLVNRVIALDTPNNGALMALFAQDVLSKAMTDLSKILMSWARGTPLGGAVSTLGNAMLNQIPSLTELAANAAFPAIVDLTPGSPYLTNLNSRTELFTNAGIESASRWRFVEWRLIGDRLCNPESACGGRAFYNYSNGVYYGLRTCWILSLIFGNRNLAIRCGVTAFIMDYLDIFWYVVTSFGDTSDGIVQGGGQYYNRARFNHLIRGADSHLGTTRSDKVRAMLDYTLQNDFGLIPLWCQTGTVSPSSISMPYLGGSQSFTVSTGTPCPWTAVSSIPWITINSGASGNASGTVAFSVDINLSPVARTGTISITGLGANLSVTVTQAGIPAAAAIGSVTINGREQSTRVPNPDYPCYPLLASPTASTSPQPQLFCPPTILLYDTGTVYITVNNHTDTVYYDRGSTAYSIALALAGAINSDPGAFVQAGIMGATVWVVSKATQGANYPFSSGTTYDDLDFTQPSFTTTNSGATLTGSP